MTKTFDELDARVTLLGEEVARLGHRDGTVRGQIEDLQGRVNAATENIQELITKPCPPAPVRFERPCFGGIYPDGDVSDCNKGSGCGGPDWEDCGYGALSPHLAEYREPAPKPERAKEYPKCPRCGRAVVGAMMTGRAIERDGQLYYHPDDISVYCESGACNYDQKLSSLPTPSRIPFENTAPKPADPPAAGTQECDSAIGELNEARRVRDIWRERAEKAEKVLLDPTAFVQRSEYEYALQEKGQWRKQAQWAKDSTENALLRAAKAEARCKELEGKAKSGHDIVEHLRNVNEQERSIRADERERVAAYCESRGFVDTVRVIRAMGDKVKP